MNTFPTQYSGDYSKYKSDFKQLKELKKRVGSENEFFRGRLELALEREYITNKEYEELK